jgi:hypothetical protein
MRKSNIYMWQQQWSNNKCKDIANLFNNEYAKKSGHKVSWPKILTKEEQFLTCNFEHICLAKDNLDDEINQTELEAAINRLKDTTHGEDQIHNCNV